MLTYKTQITLLAAALICPASYASEEEFLTWNEVRIVSPQRDDTGQVVFAAKVEGETYREINIEAFGKKYAVGKEDLAKLAAFPLSSLVTTHEAGFARTGGHMVHFKLKKSLNDPDGKLVEQKAAVTISQGQGLSVAAPHRQAEP
jgi:hypothetical protein